MIVEKDNLCFFTDKNGKPDVLLYAPQSYLEISKYIISNKIKKIALCGGGVPSQEYLNTIVDFNWIEYINGYMKGLDFSFLNRLSKLKKYIGTIDFEISNNSIEELYIGITPKTKISNECINLHTIELEGCNSVQKLFCENEYPKKLKKISFNKGKFITCENFVQNETIEELSFINCTKLKDLNNISSLKNLKSLRIENCKNLMDISDLRNNLELEQLLIINSPNIDITQIDFLKDVKILVY